MRRRGIMYLELTAVSVLLSLPIIASANSVTQGYRTKSAITKGAVVSLTQSGSQEVEKATSSNDGLLVGVVVDGPDSLVDVQPQGSQVRVGINGDVKILVSTVNGDVKAGDRLIASPLAGVAAVDYPPAPGSKYIAVAGSDFNFKSASSKKVSVDLADGSTKDVYAGLINAKLLLGNRNPSTKDKNALTTLAKQISGKDVSLVQIVASLAVFITTVVLAGMVLQGSIKGTFISLGRNPLSRDSILTGLMRVIALSIVVLGAGAVVSYIILIL